MTLSKLFKQAKARNGFTLVETIIYIALTTMALSVLLQVHISGLKTRSIALNEQILLENQRLVEYHMLERLAESNAVNDPLAGTSNILSLSSINPADNPVVFLVENERLMVSVGGGGNIPITAETVHITDFQIDRLAGSPAAVIIGIEYEIRTSDTTIGNRTEFTYTLRYDE